MVWAFARDNGIPASRFFRQVSPSKRRLAPLWRTQKGPQGEG